MVQICPNCHEKCFTDANYCGMCQTKLPNANPWLPDYKKIRTATDIDPEELQKILKTCIDSSIFRDRVFSHIVLRALKKNQSDSLFEDYMKKKILKILAHEILAEAEGGVYRLKKK